VLNEPQPVFNIEVAQQHVYELTQLGILVHNSGIDCDLWFKLRRKVLKGQKLGKNQKKQYAELLKKIKANNKEIIEEPGFICMVEVLKKAIRENAHIIEVPMTLNSDARVGKSKMKVFKTMRNYIRFMFKNMFRKR
ncbi:MAG: hypothetical protein AAF570_26190, partial [Bacteroidota bacterium]